jgi:hypothetical protein
LPTSQAVIEDGARLSVDLVTIAATPEPASFSLAVPYASARFMPMPAEL